MISSNWTPTTVFLTAGAGAAFTSVGFGLSARWGEAASLVSGATRHTAAMRWGAVASAAAAVALVGFGLHAAVGAASDAGSGTQQVPSA